jgi:hypothetical protein
MPSRGSDLLTRQGEVAANRELSRGQSRAGMVASLAMMLPNYRQARMQDEDRAFQTQHRDTQQRTANVNLQNAEEQLRDRQAMRQRKDRIAGILTSEGDIRSKFGALEQADPEFALNLREQFANASEAEAKDYGAQGDAVAQVAGAVLRMPQPQRRGAWAREISRLQGMGMIPPGDVSQAFGDDATDDDVNAALTFHLGLGLTAKEPAEQNQPQPPFAVGGSVAVPDGRGGVNFKTPPQPARERSFERVNLEGPDGSPVPANYDRAAGKYFDLQGNEIASPKPYVRPPAGPRTTRTSPSTGQEDPTFPRGVQDYLSGSVRRPQRHRLRDSSVR